MAVLRLFASIRQAAGTGKVEIAGATVGEVIAAASVLYGDEFVNLVPECRVWLNGDLTQESAQVDENDEIALLPPVSGG